jgi:hypothetical protein
MGRVSPSIAVGLTLLSAATGHPHAPELLPMEGVRLPPITLISSSSSSTISSSIDFRVL